MKSQCFSCSVKRDPYFQLQLFTRFLQILFAMLMMVSKFYCRERFLSVFFMLEFVLSNGIVNSYIFHCSHSHWMFFNVFKLLSVVSFNCFHVKLFCMGTLIYVCMNNFQLKKQLCVCAMDKNV